MRRIINLLIIIPVFCVLISCRQQSRQPTVLNDDPYINESISRLFLAKNKLQQGVHTLPSGLQYSIIREGAGPRPTPNDTVVVNYIGRSINGKVFDGTHATSKPIALRVSNMIPGWQQAIILMSHGSIWNIYVPPNLAYGQKGIPGKIAPNETVIYTINLLRINPARAR